MSYTIVPDSDRLEIRATLKSEHELEHFIEQLVYRTAKGDRPFFRKENPDDRPDVPAV